MASIRWSHWTWEECRVFWEAKGYKLDSIAAEFEKKFGENSGFSRTTLAERSKSTEEAPPEVIELVWSLALVPGASKRRFEIVKRGLEEGAPLADLEALLADTGRKFDAILSAMGKLGASLSALGGKVDAILSAVSKLAAAVSALGGKLEAVLSALRSIEATVNHTDAKQDVGQAMLERATRKIVRAVYGSAGFLGLGVAAVAVAFVQCQHVQPAAPASQNVTLNLGTGIAEQAAKGGQWDPYGFLVHAITGEMGERKAGRPMPHHPLPHQAKAPCQGSADTLYGGCWLLIGNRTAPCPPDLYQDGTSCYAPVAADPNVPVEPSSEEPRPGKGEPTGEQPRPMQEMPGKEQ